MSTFKHPRGLALLFLTEMWERYSFYALQALLVLYMAAKLSDGGLGWSKATAISIFGYYSSAAYLTPIIGGYLADRFIGQRLSAMIGAWMMAIGHFCMAINDVTIFFLSLALIALGNGFFKPCLTTILGEIYDDASESQKDSAYSIFYMGINLGAFLSGIVSGWLLKHYGFDAGFTAAGVGMVVATLIFWWGKERFLGEAGKKPQVKIIDHHVKPLSYEEKRKLGVVAFLFLIVTIFMAAWMQTGGVIPLFINESIDRHFFDWEIPTPLFASLNPAFIFIGAPLLSFLWTWLGKKGIDPFIGNKIAIGCILLSASFLLLTYISQAADPSSGSLPHWGWIAFAILLLSFAELLVIPISWAAVTSLAPKSYVTRCMALMLMGIGIGSYLAGWFGSQVEHLGEETIFKTLATLMAITAVVCVFFNKTLKKLSHIE